LKRAEPVSLAQAVEVLKVRARQAEVKLNQADGMHPNPAGVDLIVARILPSVERLLEQVAAK
jgi:lysophospholipase L1-like esterase